MKLIDLMNELKCTNYYLVELRDDVDIDECDEYFTPAIDVDAALYGCEVIDHDEISKDFAVIYLDMDSLNKDIDADVNVFVDSLRDLLSNFDTPISMVIQSSPQKNNFTIAVNGMESFFNLKED